MFKKMASEALGLSDIGKIIPPSDYNKVEADDYILHEDGEKIFFLIKSKQDEYCFTNRALIHVDGTSAMSKKRTLKRYEYYKYPVSSVLLETAGTIDLDVEIKFKLGVRNSASSISKTSSAASGGVSFSIDVDKNQLEQLKDLYKALYAMSMIESSNYSDYNGAYDTLNKAIQVMANNRSEGVNQAEELEKVTNYISKFLGDAKQKYVKKDYSDVFLKYINN
ncbi:PH domain-containing protein [Bernardetia sp.]|uniref:PH domain-containing protein n=1 Tax=Bernardetia sp. TaxID=1937974 RepID=UPI0025C3F06B|nr:PH domain-containing protein [Bernardetia sp.]